MSGGSMNYFSFTFDEPLAIMTPFFCSCFVGNFNLPPAISLRLLLRFGSGSR